MWGGWRTRTGRDPPSEGPGERQAGRAGPGVHMKAASFLHRHFRARKGKRPVLGGLLEVRQVKALLVHLGTLTPSPPGPVPSSPGLRCCASPSSEGRPPQEQSHAPAASSPRDGNAGSQTPPGEGAVASDRPSSSGPALVGGSLPLHSPSEPHVL